MDSEVERIARHMLFGAIESIDGLTVHEVAYDFEVAPEALSGALDRARVTIEFEKGA